LFLNNRHYDPTTGVFVSVDPLVEITGEPYIYGAANPVTNSDPSGLDPDTSAHAREQAGGCDGGASDLRSCNPIRDRHTSQEIRDWVRDNFTACPGQFHGFGPKCGGSGPDTQQIDELVGLASGMVPTTFGVCGEAGASAFGIGLSGTACAVTAPDGDGTTVTLGVATGLLLPEVSVGLATLASNAPRLEALGGAGICASGSAGAGGAATVTICGGLTDSGDLNGTVSVLTGGQLSLLGLPQVSLTALATYTWVIPSAEPHIAAGDEAPGRYDTTSCGFYNPGQPVFSPCR